MSQRNRRILAAAGLMAAFFLALPAPSRAAGLRETGGSAGVAVRVWSWLEGLGLTPRWPAPAHRSASRWEKQGTKAGSDSVAPVPSASTGTEQGSGIDPNGHK